MPFDVFPNPQMTPHHVGPGLASPALIRIVERIGVDNVAETGAPATSHLTTMFIRLAMLGPAPALPSGRPTIILKANTGGETEITTSFPTPTLIPDGASPEVADAFTLDPDANNVYLLKVLVFVTERNWKMRIKNNDAVARDFTWVVADGLAASRQPWIDLTKPTLPLDAIDYDTFVGGHATRRTLTVSNNGTGPLTIGDAPGAATTGSPNLILAVVPGSIDPNHSGDLQVDFTPPATIGTTHTEHLLSTNDSLALATAGHNRKIALSARTRKLEIISRLLYGGNGTTSVDSGLPFVGTFYGVAQNGDLLWYRYNGRGEQDPSGSRGWHPNSGNPIGHGWNRFKHLLGCGDGLILGVLENGDLLWHSYEGNGESDVTGSTGWHPNSGNPIGNGWHGVQLLVFPQAGHPSNRLKILAVAQNGVLLWYSYEGNGESDITGSTGWHPNSGHPIGNGWQSFRHLHGSGNVIFAVQENGDLLWYSYNGHGESDGTGWHPNSGNAIGNGWQGFRHIFGGATDSGGFGHVLYTVTENGDLLWYRYDGQGEADPSGVLGWVANSGNQIGRGW